VRAATSRPTISSAQCPDPRKQLLEPPLARGSTLFDSGAVVLLEGESSKALVSPVPGLDEALALKPSEGRVVRTRAACATAPPRATVPRRA
jgi:hypothetical protein